MTDWLQTGSRSSGQDWINGLYQQSARQTAGGQLAAGQTRQAANTLFESGDLAGGQALQTSARTAATASRAQQIEAAQRAARAWAVARDSGQDLPSAIAASRPALLALGTDPNDLAQIEQQAIANPAFIDQIGSILDAEAMKFSTVSGGNGDQVVIGLNERTGASTSRLAYAAPRDPIVTPTAVITPPNRGLAAGQAPLPGQAAPVPMAGPAIGSAPLYEATPPPPAEQPARDVGFEDVLPALLEREGGFVASDGRSGAPANFGINQRANPDVDVRNLTREQAADLYRDRYWEPVVQAGVPGYAREAVFDFAVNAGPSRAIRLWEQAGGDVGKFNDLRLAHYRSLPDYAQNGRSWERRVEETSGAIAQGDDAQDPLVPGAPRVETTADGYRIERFTDPREEQRARAEARAESREERMIRQSENTEARAAREASTAASARTFTQENQLRGQLGQNQAIKDLAAVRPQVGIIGDIASRAARGEQISAQDDLALIFSFMKILDPGSVVREGEFANAQNTAGIPDRVMNAYNNALRGTRLSDGQRNEFFRTATRAISQYDQAALAAIERTRSTTQAYGLDADRVAPLPPRRERSETPRLRFQPTEAQTRLSSEIVRSRPSQGRRGERTNPILINPADPNASFANVPRGGYFITPDGQLRGPKP